MINVIKDLYISLHGATMSQVLIMLVLFDTLLVMKTRLTISKTWLSKKLMIGFMINSAMAFIPYFLDLVAWNPFMAGAGAEDINTVRMFSWAVFAIVSIGLSGSVMANVAVAFPKFLPAVSIVERFLPLEYAKKVANIEKELNKISDKKEE